jgi:heme exporter protein CcmD
MSGDLGFFAMGGYGFYIWSSWGVAAGILIAVTCHSLIRSYLVKEQLNRHLTDKTDGDHLD